MKTLIKYMLFKTLLSLFFTLGKILKKEQLPKVAEYFGNFIFILPWSRKKIAMNNINIAFGSEHGPKNLTKKFFREVILIALEVAHIVKKGEKLSNYASAKGLEYLNEALKQGRGVIAISGHIGNIPVMLAWLAEKGYPVAVLFKEGKYLPEGFLYNLIKSYKIYPIPFRSDREVPKEIISALNKNMIVFILADQARPGIYAKFFGKYVQCQKGAFVIAQRKGSPLVPIFIVRGENGHEIKIYPEIELQKQVEILIEKYNCLLEELIRKYPEQYYWFHRRFKRMRVH